MNKHFSDIKSGGINEFEIRRRVENCLKEIISDEVIKEELKSLNISYEVFEKFETIQLFEILNKLIRLLNFKKCEQTMNNVENLIIKNLISLNSHINTCNNDCFSDN